MMSETVATSNYLNRPCRTEDEALAAFERNRKMRRAWDLVKRLRHQAHLIRQGGGNINVEKRAGQLLDEAIAVEWLLSQQDERDERAEAGDE